MHMVLRRSWYKSKFRTRVLLGGILFLFLFYSFSSTVFSQPLGENFVITQFGLEEGLPQSSVNDIIQTKDGYIWLATFGGLVRFDGNSFTTFNQSNTPGMLSDRLLGVYADEHGGIWLFPETTNTTLLRFKEGECTSHTIHEGLSGLTKMFEDDEGTLWFLSSSSVYRFNGSTFIEVEIEEDKRPVDQVKQIDGGTWFGFDNRLFKTNGETVFEVSSFMPDLQSNIIGVYHIEGEGNTQKLIVATSSGGITEVEMTSDTLSFEKFDLPYSFFLNMYINDKKNLFAITAAGIAIKSGAEYKVFNPLDIQEGVRLKAILQDNEGNYWLGTEGDGLYRLRNSIISMIDKENGLENEKMLSLTKLRNGTVLLSTNCDGIYEWKNNQASLSRIHSFFPKGCYWSIFEDSKGRIWVGGGKPYMTEALDKPGKVFGDKDGVTGFGVYAITEDSRGNIWVGTGKGIFIYNGDHFETGITKEDGLYFSDARSFFEDEEEVMWVGTKGGLNTIKGDKISKIELLKDEDDLNQPEVRAIHKDKDGALWIGTYGDGLFRILNEEITQLKISDGLFDNIVSHVIEDENGNFWMGSNRGISRIKREHLNDYISGEKQVFDVSVYTNADGMNSAETNGGFQPSTFVDSLGHIYFPTVAGVAVVDPAKVEKNNVPPPVYIENLMTDEEELSLKGPIELDYNTSYLDIKYTAVSFTDPTKVEFKYRMNGLDDGWIDVGTQRSALYSKIPPGKYEFQVIASNNDGVWNYEGASLAIAVIPPFWQTSWFYGFIGLLFISSGGGIYFFRIRQLQTKNERQKKFTEQLIVSQENERRRIASELHDGLGQQILVIKNRVELAQQQAQGARQELVEQLNEIRISAERSIGDVRNIAHGLRPVLLEKFGLTEAIINLCDQLQSTSQIEWSYHIDDIDEMIPRNKEIHFYRVLQEGVKNILNHSSAKEASVIVRRMDNMIQARIWDDGKGFDSKAIEHFKGLGLSGMNERIETLGGTLQVQSALNEGAAITILIPLQEL